MSQFSLTSLARHPDHTGMISASACPLLIPVIEETFAFNFRKRDFHWHLLKRFANVGVSLLFVLLFALCAQVSSGQTTNVHVRVSPLFTVTITPGGPTTFCAGGSVTLNSSGAGAGGTYLWSPGGATTESIVVTTGGNYKVTVTRSNGNSATSAATTVTVNPLPAKPTITAGGPTTFCTGGSVTLTSSNSTSYLWTPGNQTANALTVTSSGNYKVTVTDNNGCSATSAAKAVTVNKLPRAVITPNGPTIFCSTGKVTLTSSPGSHYNWSPGGETTKSVFVTTPDNYTVKVTDSNGCSATSPATIVIMNDTPSLTITQGQLSAFCQGGAVVLTAISTTATGYLWSNSATTRSINTYTSGKNSVTVTNAAGCTSTSSTTVKYDAGSLLSSYVILGVKQVVLKNNTVFNGGLGVIDSCTGCSTKSNGAEVEQGSLITGTGTFVSAKPLHVDSTSLVTTRQVTAPQVQLPVFVWNPYCGSKNNMTVSGTHTLTDSLFGSVNIADGATVTFTQPNLFIGQLTTGSNVSIIFTQPCAVLHICNQAGTGTPVMNMGINNMFNTDGKSVIIYAAGDVHVSNGSDFNGSIYSKGILTVNGTPDKGTCTYCAPTTMTGMYIGEQVDGYNFVNWHWNPVCVTCRPNRPNVLVILFDDSRYDSYKLDGGPDVFKSPAIDSIAEEGVRFNLTFPDFSLCAPSRASIYTGLYPCKTGVHVNGDSLHNGLTNKTVAYILQKQAGYYTGLVGKYGLTLPPEFKHAQVPPGYNYWFSNENSGYFNLSYDDNGHSTFISGHKTDIFTAHAIDFLQSVPTNTPFLLFLNQHAPHVPYTPRPKDKGFFKGVPLPFPSSYEKYTYNYPSILYPRYMEQYDHNYKHDAHDTLLRDSLTEGQYEMLLGLESSVSSVIRELKNEGKYDSTIIIITSDNGYLLGEHYLQGKQLAYEPSIRLPLYIRYPEWFSPGMVIDSEIAMNIDLFPTILNAAGVTDTFHDQQGLVLRDLANSRVQRKQFLYTMDYGDNDPAIRAVRSLRYKLIKTLCANSTEEFYDLHNDPNEDSNLIFNPAYKTLISHFRFELDSSRTAIDDQYNQSLPDCFLVPNSTETTDALNTILDDPPSDKLDIFNSFPNPVADHLNLEIYNPLFANLVFRIYDITGEEKSQGLISDRKQVEFFSIPFNQLPAGVYCIQVNDGRNTSTIKVIKQ